MNSKIADFVRQRQPETPFLVVDLDVVEGNYRALRRALPNARVFYAVKANPAPEILERLCRLGSSFDAASLNEVELVLAAGATPNRISFGNTIKKETHIARAFDLGVRLFAFDSQGEMEKLAVAAPGSRVFCRIQTSNEGAEWPLSRKFGCDLEMAHDLLVDAAARGLVPCGISFHVGSQQGDPGQWDSAIEAAARMFHDLKARGITLDLVNLGGGFPARYLTDVPVAEAYGEAIQASLLRHFGNRIPDTIIEPGRGMVGDAGIIFSEVVLIARKGAEARRRWVYLDIGKFGGLAETMDESIRYPILSDRQGAPEPVIIAGPTCDSADVLYDKADYHLPNDLKVGDRVEIRSTGAYTSSYSSVGFNGFGPLAAYCI